MIDDPLEQQLLTLQRVEAPPPPSVADLERLLRRGREQKTRARRLAVAASAAAVAAGAGTVWTLGMRDPGGDQSVDMSSEGSTSPDDNVDVSGSSDCDLAGPDPTTDPDAWDVDGVSDALEARYPSCFGGIVNTGEALGPFSVDLYVVGEDPAVLELAEELFGPEVAVTMRPSDMALSDIRDVKHRIDDDMASGFLEDEGIVVNGASIRFLDDGPRVYVLLGTDTPEVRARLEEIYGPGRLDMVESSGVLPG
jgi:hypothetical protein